MRGNSIFDPDATSGSNSQPTGADQWAAFYNRYYVAASKIKIRAINASSTQIQNIMLYPSLSDTYDHTNQYPLEYPYTKSVLLATAGSNNTATMGHYMTTQKIFGRRGTEFESNYIGVLAATGGGDPVSDWYWHIVALNQSGSNVIDVMVDIKLVYYVKVFNRIDLDQS